MTLAELDYLDMAEADRLRRDTRIDAIMGAPEAAHQQLAAFALLLRTDVPANTAVLFLRQAPELRTVDEVSSWVAAIPRQPDMETRQ